MSGLLNRLWKDESGQATVEYALVIGLAAMGVIGAVTLFRTELIALWGRITDVVKGVNPSETPAAK